MGFFAGKINIGSQGLQRHLALFQFFLTSDIRAAESAGEHQTHAFHIAVSHYLFNRLFHYSTKWQAFFQAFGNHLTDYRRVGFRRFDFLNVQFEVLVK